MVGVAPGATAVTVTPYAEDGTAGTVQTYTVAVLTNRDGSTALDAGSKIKVYATADTSAVTAAFDNVSTSSNLFSDTLPFAGAALTAGSSQEYTLSQSDGGTFTSASGNTLVLAFTTTNYASPSITVTLKSA